MANMIGSIMTSNDGTSNFKDYLLKGDCGKEWSVYRVNRHCKLKPYGVVVDDQLCAPRYPHALEQEGNAPAKDTMSEEEYFEYQVDIAPPAFLFAPVACYTGKDTVTFVDHCSDLATYAMPESLNTPPTPFTVFMGKLLKTVPSERFTPRTRSFPSVLQAASEFKLSRSRMACIMRGALFMHNGKEVSSKRAIEGVHWKAVMVVHQTSAVRSLLKMLSTKVDVRKPLTADNTALKDVFFYNGTYLDFDKVSSERGSGVEVRVDYDEAFNHKFESIFGIQDDATYNQVLTDMFQSYPEIADMLNIMTVQQMIDMLVEQYPPAWVWYGLKDSPYAELVPKATIASALKDAEFAEEFGVVAEGVPQVSPSSQGTQRSYTPPPVPSRGVPRQNPAVRQPMSPSRSASRQSVQESDIPSDFLPVGAQETDDPSATEGDAAYARLTAKYGNYSN